MDDDGGDQTGVHRGILQQLAGCLEIEPSDDRRRPFLAPAARGTVFRTVATTTQTIHAGPRPSFVGSEPSSYGLTRLRGSAKYGGHSDSASEWWPA